jgi:hypothetical protein
MQTRGIMTTALLESTYTNTPKHTNITPQPRLSTHYAASGLLPRQLVGQETLVGSEIMKLLSSNSPKADELRCALA